MLKLNLTTNFKKCLKHDCVLLTKNQQEFCLECATEELKSIFAKSNLENLNNEIRNT